MKFGPVNQSDAVPQVEKTGFCEIITSANIDKTSKFDTERVGHFLFFPYILKLIYINYINNLLYYPYRAQHTFLNVGECS